MSISLFYFQITRNSEEPSLLLLLAPAYLPFLTRGNPLPYKLSTLLPHQEISNEGERVIYASPSNDIFAISRADCADTITELQSNVSGYDEVKS